MTEIHEHTVDLSLLPEKGNILDVGCRGFDFTNYFKGLGHNVHSIDCDILSGQDYHWLALTDHNGMVGVERFQDKQATRITIGNQVQAITLERFSSLVNVDWWDVIKLDIEGSEYEVIMSLKTPPAKQISIEFHLHTDIYGTRELEQMESKLFQLGYEAAQHKREARHGLKPNWWDSLWIFRE